MTTRKNARIDPHSHTAIPPNSMLYTRRSIYELAVRFVCWSGGGAGESRHSGSSRYSTAQPRSAAKSGSDFPNDPTPAYDRVGQVRRHEMPEEDGEGIAGEVGKIGLVGEGVHVAFGALVEHRVGHEVEVKAFHAEVEGPVREIFGAPQANGRVRYAHPNLSSEKGTEASPKAHFSRDSFKYGSVLRMSSRRLVRSKLQVSPDMVGIGTQVEVVVADDGQSKLWHVLIIYF